MTFSTTARRIRIDEGYVRTMLGQKDNSISISYVDYDDPQLFAQLCLAHINVLRAFDTISIYNAWLRRVDDVLDSNWCKTDVFIKGDPNYIFSAFVNALDTIVNNNTTRVN